jgi:hypothetical protein
MVADRPRGAVDFDRPSQGLHPVQLGQLRGHGGLDQAQLEAERDQSLLGAVVQVALDPAPGVVGGGDDPGPGRGELGAAVGVRDRCAGRAR